MRKLLIGCGVLAGLLVVTLVVAGMLVSSWVKKRLPATERLEQMQAEVRERFGDPAAWVPPVGAELPADRVATFVALRESLATQRTEVAAGLDRFLHDAKASRPENPTRLEKILHGIGLAQGGFTMVSGLLDYVHARLRLGLANGMGEGEYAWYYALSTFAWLQWNPLAEEGKESALRAIDMLNEAHEGRRELAHMFTAQLGSLRRALEEKTARTRAEEDLLQHVRTGLDAARGGDGLPLAGALPPAWAAALEPYRARLTATLPKEPAEIFLDWMLVQGERASVRFDWPGRRTGGRRSDAGR
jgi:hypothetical protein